VTLQNPAMDLCNYLKSATGCQRELLLTIHRKYVVQKPSHTN